MGYGTSADGNPWYSVQRRGIENVCVLIVFQNVMQDRPGDAHRMVVDQPAEARESRDRLAIQRDRDEFHVVVCGRFALHSVWLRESDCGEQRQRHSFLGIIFPDGG